jgi:hypothetical protein
MSSLIAPKLLAEFIGTFSFVFIGAAHHSWRCLRSQSHFSGRHVVFRS